MHRPSLFGLLVAVPALALMGSVCDPSYTPCDEYVDYICDCHADDPEYDCEELSIAYQNGDPDLQDECQVALAEQEEQDEQDGFACASDTGL